MSAPAPALPQVVRFLPYQRAWIADDSRFKIGMFARQTGKTFTTGGECVDDCVRAWVEDRRVRWVILSRGERQAAEMMAEVIKPFTAAFYGVYNTLLRGGEPSFHEGEFRSPQAAGPDAVCKALEVRFPNGSRITALPANPDTARGFSANVILDEFAFHARSRDIWAALFPVISRTGLKLRVISTPNGKGNKFHELMTAEGSVWSRHVVDIHEAVRQGLERDIDMLRRGMADEDAWAQEYELKWLDEASAWIDYDLIAGCEHPEAGRPELYRGGLCFVGVDIAARNDLFVIWVLEQVGDVLWTREIIARRRISFAEQDRLLDEVMSRYRVVRVRIDQTGMGEKPVEDAQRRHGALRVEGVQFTAAAKLDMATALKEAMQDRRARIPAGDVALRADLHAIKAQVGITGTRRLVADGDSDGHADRFWAGALAVSAAREGSADYAYRPAGRGAGGAGEPEDALRPWWRRPAGAGLRGRL
jgi:phage FluMu gp28-like protein